MKHGSGFCYGKSHLLAALLRANNIPAALCYQRLRCDDGKGDEKEFCLHGLNAVFLQNFGWYRMDPRGNKPGVDAQFNPPQEQLAFVPSEDGEVDIEERFSDPLPQVINSLTSFATVAEVANNLPDLTEQEIVRFNHRV